MTSREATIAHRAADTFVVSAIVETVVPFGLSMPRQVTTVKVDCRRWPEGKRAVQTLLKRGWRLIDDGAAETFYFLGRSYGSAHARVEIDTPELVLTMERYGDGRLVRLDADRLTHVLATLTEAARDGFLLDWDDVAEDCFCYAVCRHHPESVLVLSDDQLARGIELKMLGDSIFILALFKPSPT